VEYKAKSAYGVINWPKAQSECSRTVPIFQTKTFGRKILVLQDGFFNLGPSEVLVAVFFGLVLFGPETLKSLTKDVGRAAAELKELPKTFKEGMDEGAVSSEVAKMKAMAAEKRKKREEKLASATSTDEDTEGDDEST